MKKVDEGRIRAAIVEAERGTDAVVGVHVAHKTIDDALDHAKQQFHRARLHEHRAGRSVLFVVAPRSRKVAVYGGKTIHLRVGDAFWQEVVDEMTPLFAEDRPTEALVRGIERVGKELRVHFAVEQTT